MDQDVNQGASADASLPSGHPGTEDKKPFWVKCGSCKHIWTAAYLPMVAETFAKIAMRQCCPMCGARKGIFVAKQNNGILLEQSA